MRLPAANVSVTFGQQAGNHVPISLTSTGTALFVVLTTEAFGQCASAGGCGSGSADPVLRGMDAAGGRRRGTAQAVAARGTPGGQLAPRVKQYIGTTCRGSTRPPQRICEGVGTACEVMLHSWHPGHAQQTQYAGNMQALPRGCNARWRSDRKPSVSLVSSDLARALLSSRAHLRLLVSSTLRRLFSACVFSSLAPDDAWSICTRSWAFSRCSAASWSSLLLRVRSADSRFRKIRDRFFASMPGGSGLTCLRGACARVGGAAAAATALSAAALAWWLGARR